MKMKTSDLKLWDFHTVARMVGAPNPERVRYAVQWQRIVEPLVIGKVRLFTQEQIDVLTRHFAEKGAK
jgi:hypothetical protein